MKKLLSALLAATMVFSSVVMSVSAEGEAKTVSATTGITLYAETDSTGGTLASKDRFSYAADYEYRVKTFETQGNATAINPIVFTVNAATAGTYSLVVSGGLSYNNSIALYLNDAETATYTDLYEYSKNWSTTGRAVTSKAYSVTLTEGENTLTFKSTASTANAQIYSIRLYGEYVSDNAKRLDTDGTVTIAYNDTAVTGQKTVELSTGVTGTYLDSYVKTYVYAPEAGNYTIQYTGRYTAHSRKLYLFVNGVKQAEGVSYSATGIIPNDAGTTTPKAGGSYTITLDKGNNLIQVSTNATNTGTNTQQGFTQLTITGPFAAPAGVTPAAVSLNNSATIAYNNAAVVLTEQTLSNGFTGSSWKTASPVYVNAAEAGTYNVVWTTVDLFQSSRTGDLYVNGVKVASELTTTTRAGVETASYGYDVELRQGLNSIYLISSVGNNQKVWTSVTIAGETYGLPTIDTVANEGDVRVTWQAEAATSADTHVGGALPYEVAVNCLTAGDYYFIPYYQRSHTDGSLNHVAVNGVEVATPNNTLAGASQVAQGYTVFKAVPIKVTLNAGKNTIVFTPSDSNLHADKFELVNFAVAEGQNTTTGLYSSAIVAYAGFVTETTTVASTPKVITKDKLSQTIPAGAATANVTALVADDAASTACTRQLVLASYDVNGKLLGVKLGTGNAYGKYAHQMNVSGLDLTGAETVKLMVINDFTNLTRITDRTFTK